MRDYSKNQIPSKYRFSKINEESLPNDNITIVWLFHLRKLLLASRDSLRRPARDLFSRIGLKKELMGCFQHLNARCDFFGTRWKPKSWSTKQRFVFIRTRNRKQYKEPVQLDLFIPYEYGHDFNVIVTNKRLGARKVLAYHDGRGAQEGLFAELKSQNQMDYIPTRQQASNQVFVLAAMLAHNLNREMQMMAQVPERRTTERRAPLWRFTQLGTLRRQQLIQRAGRLTKPYNPGLVGAALAAIKVGAALAAIKAVWIWLKAETMSDYAFG